MRTKEVMNGAIFIFPCFSVQPDNRRIFIWRKRGTGNNIAFAHESVRFGGGGVFPRISIDVRPDLYITRNGALTVRRYRDEFLMLQQLEMTSY